MKRYYPSIQILRAVLFFLILAFHCNVPYANLGWGGVETFFVISAYFLVLKQFGNQELNIMQQVKRRIFRLYPPYVVVLFIAVLYTILIQVFPYDVFAHSFSLQNIQWMLADYSSPMQPMTAHTWTLAIEIWAGVFWLILLKIVPQKYFRVVMYGMLVLGISYRTITIILGLNNWIVSLCPLAHFDALALGSLLAIKVREGKKISRRTFIYSIVGGSVGIFVCIIIIAANNQVGIVQAYQLLSSSKNYLDNWFTGNIYFFISLLSTGIISILLVYDNNKDKNGIMKKSLVFLGDNSYCLYLFHWPILSVIRKISDIWSVTLLAVLGLTIIATVIYAKFYLLIDNKCKSICKMKI